MATSAGDLHKGHHGRGIVSKRRDVRRGRGRFHVQTDGDVRGRFRRGQNRVQQNHGVPERDQSRIPHVPAPVPAHVPGGHQEFTLVHASRDHRRGPGRGGTPSRTGGEHQETRLRVSRVPCGPQVGRQQPRHFPDALVARHERQSGKTARAQPRAAAVSQLPGVRSHENLLRPLSAVRQVR